MIKRMSAILFLRYWQKQCSNSFVLYCLYHSQILHNSVTRYPIVMRFGSKLTMYWSDEKVVQENRNWNFSTSDTFPLIMSHESIGDLVQRKYTNQLFMFRLIKGLHVYVNLVPIPVYGSLFDKFVNSLKLISQTTRPMPSFQVWSRAITYVMWSSKMSRNSLILISRYSK